MNKLKTALVSAAAGLGRRTDAIRLDAVGGPGRHAAPGQRHTDTYHYRHAAALLTRHAALRR